MTPRHLMLAGGLAVAGWLAFFGDKTPKGDIAEATATVAPRQPAASTSELSALRIASAPETKASKAVMPASVPAAKLVSATDILVLLPREELIGGARSAETAALFASQSWAPPPPPPPPKQAHEQEQDQPPPSAPPLPFTYLGKKSEDGAWEVYLAHGDKTHIVREKSVIDGTYRIESIKPPTLSVTYMPLNELQELSIGGAE